MTCIACSHSLHRHGQRYRLVMQLWIQMLKCPNCKKCISLLPTFCTPFKHHSVQTVNEVIDLLLIEYVSGLFLYQKNYSFAVLTAKRWARDFIRFLPKLSAILSGFGIIPPIENYHSFKSSLESYFKQNASFIKEDHYFIEIQNVLGGRSPPCSLFCFLS